MAGGDLISFGASRGLLDEQAARRRLGDAPATAEKLVELGLLRAADLGPLMESYHAELAVTLNVLSAAPAHCGRCGDRMARRADEIVCARCGIRVKPDGVGMPPEAAEAMRDPANRTGRYVKLRELGHGGFGSVWLAWEIGLGRYVALKFLTAQGPDDVARFQREASLAAGLTHPNIAAVYEVNQTPPYIAMQYVEGQTAGEMKPAVPEALRIVKAAAEAVHYAHGKGIIHRDLKPQNIMVDAGGRVFVMDFGLAKRTDVESTLSQSGIITGTPSYMSPEQAEGHVHLDARTDVYSLGATLHALLSGGPPFCGPPIEVLRKVLHDEPPPLKVDRDPRTIVATAMEKESGRRYRSAIALAEDIGRYLAGDAIEARPASPAYRLGKKLAKRRAVVAAAALGLVAASILATQWFMTEMARRRSAEQTQARDRVQKLLTDASDLQYDGRATAEQIHAAAREVVAQAEAVLGEYGEDPRLYLYRGRARRLLGEDAAAEADFLRAVELDPDEGSAHYDLGWMYLERILDSTHAGSQEEREKQMEEARKEWLPRAKERFDRAIGSGKVASQERLLARLWGLYLEGKYAEARGECGGTIELGGRVEGFYHLRGVLAGDAEARLKDYTEAVRRAPNNARFRFDRGWAKGNLGDWKGAIEDYTRAIELNRDFAEAYNNLGGAKGNLDDWKGAIEDYARAIELKKDFAEAYNNLGGAKGNLGDWKGLIEACTHAIELKNNFAEAYYNRGTAKRNLGDSKGPIEDYTRAIELKKDDAVAYYNRGIAKGNLGDFQGEIEDCTRAIELKKDYAHAYYNRGVAKHQLGDSKGAIEDYTRAIELKKDDADAYHNRGWAKGNLVGGHKGAIEDYTRAIELKKDDADAYYNRAIAREAMAETDEPRRRELLAGAAADYQAALMYAAEAWTHRAAVEAALGRVQAALEKLDAEF